MINSYVTRKMLFSDSDEPQMTREQPEQLLEESKISIPEDIPLITREQIEHLKEINPEAKCFQLDSITDLTLAPFVHPENEDEIEKDLPVYYIDQSEFEIIDNRKICDNWRMPVNLLEVSENWRKFVEPRLLALQWVREQYEAYEINAPEIDIDAIRNDVYDEDGWDISKFLNTLFSSMKPDQIAMVQQGYFIEKYNYYPPLLDGSLYVIDLELDRSAISKSAFPYKRKI